MPNILQLAVRQTRRSNLSNTPFIRLILFTATFPLFIGVLTYSQQLATRLRRFARELTKVRSKYHARPFVRKVANTFPRDLYATRRHGFRGGPIFHD